MFISYCLWSISKADARTQFKALLNEQSKSLADQIELVLYDRIQNMVQLKRRMERSQKLLDQEWIEDASYHIAHHSEYKRIAFINSETVVRWVEPKEENAFLVGLKLKAIGNYKQALDEAGKTGNVYLTSIIKDHFSLFIPIFQNKNTPSGYVMASFNLKQFFTYLTERSELDLNIEIYENGHKKLELSEINKQATHFRSLEDIRFFSSKWELRATPKQNFIDTHYSKTYHWVLVVGALFSFFLAVMTYLYQTSELQKTYLTDINKQLIVEKEKNADLAKMKGAFLHSVTHEFRTPLNGILGAVQVIETFKEFKEIRDYVKIIHQSGYSLLKIVENILTYAEVEAESGYATLDVNLKELVLNTFEPYQAVFHRKALKHEFTSNFPDTIKVIGDPDKLQKMVAHLVENAIKFTLHGSVKLHLELEKETRTTIRIRLAITDTGVGIAKEYHGLIFDKMFQIDRSTERQFDGIGLGLATVKKICNYYNGRVEVESDVDIGSTFTLFMQFEKADYSQMSEMAKDVLVFEPDVVSQSFIEAYLIRKGYRVTFIESEDKIPKTAVLSGYYKKFTFEKIAHTEFHYLDRESYEHLLNDIL